MRVHRVGRGHQVPALTSRPPPPRPRSLPRPRARLLQEPLEEAVLGRAGGQPRGGVEDAVHADALLGPVLVQEAGAGGHGGEAVPLPPGLAAPCLLLGPAPVLLQPPAQRRVDQHRAWLGRHHRPGSAPPILTRAGGLHLARGRARSSRGVLCRRRCSRSRGVPLIRMSSSRNRGVFVRCSSSRVVLNRFLLCVDRRLYCCWQGAGGTSCWAGSPPIL